MQPTTPGLKKSHEGRIVTDGGQPNTASGKIDRHDDKLGPFREASIVRGSVHVEKVRGNLVEQMFFSADDWRDLLALVSSDGDGDGDGGRSIVTDGGHQVDLGGETVGDGLGRLVNASEDGERKLLVVCPLCGKDWRAEYAAGRHDHDDVKTHLRGHDHERFFETTSVDPKRQPRGDGQQRLVPDGGHPFDDIDRDGERIGEQWPNSRPQRGHTRRDSRLKRHADWQAGVIVGWLSAALAAVVWAVVRR